MSADRGEFRRIGERERLELGFLSVVTGTFVGPDGFTFEREIVRHPGAVCVVPLEADRKVVAVRQYRSAIDRPVLEIPAGKMDVPGEAPLLGARRELAEEVGLEAGTITPLASFFNSPGFTDEHTFMFLGEELVEVGQATVGIEEQYMTIERFALDEIGELVRRGEIIDAKTIIACYLALDLLAQRAAGGERGGGPTR
jgi:ADP-ribose pyrophosphatase